MGNAKSGVTSNTPSISVPKKSKKQAIKTALATAGYRVGRGMINGHALRYVIQFGGVS